jgi:tetratricopeptide (TPR) repeat protein
MNDEAASELRPEIYSAIKAYCARGDELAAVKSYEDAITQYNQAWLLVPDPKNEWTASSWILAAIADAAFLGGYKTSAIEALEYAMTCPGAIGNPFLHLRFGQVLFDKGELDAAADELMRAYMFEGEEIFSSEDPQYLAFLRTRAKI